MAELLIKGAFFIETKDGFSVHPKVIELLKEIEKTESLNAAVENIGMSYSYAWNLIHKTTCKLDTPLLFKRRGGNGGGVAKLTAEGNALLQYYRKLEHDFLEFMGTHKIDLATVSPDDEK